MSKSLIAVDVGNSFLHVGRYALDERDEFGVPRLVTHTDSWSGVLKARTADRAWLDTIGASQKSGDEPWFVVSVNREREAQLAGFIRATFAKAEYRLLHVDDFGLRIDVHQPQRVGRDRIAAGLAAYQMRGDSAAVIVVDAGTAVTVDRVDSPGVFRGGAIFPGHYLLADSLHRHTDALPLVQSPGEPPPPVGKNTEAAIQSGLFWGSVGAIRELISRMRAEINHSSKLFLTGGMNQEVIAGLLQATPVSDLVLRGVALAAARCLRR